MLKVAKGHLPFLGALRVMKQMKSKHPEVNTLKNTSMLEIMFFFFLFFFLSHLR